MSPDGRKLYIAGRAGWCRHRSCSCSCFCCHCWLLLPPVAAAATIAESFCCLQLQRLVAAAAAGLISWSDHDRLLRQLNPPGLPASIHPWQPPTRAACESWICGPASSVRTPAMEASTSPATAAQVGESSCQGALAHGSANAPWWRVGGTVARKGALGESRHWQGWSGGGGPNVLSSGLCLQRRAKNAVGELHRLHQSQSMPAAAAAPGVCTSLPPTSSAPEDASRHYCCKAQLVARTAADQSLPAPLLRAPAATKARIDQIRQISVSPVDGSLFIADQRNHRIRRVDAKTGIIRCEAVPCAAASLGRHGQQCLCWRAPACKLPQLASTALCPPARSVPPPRCAGRLLGQACGTAQGVT